MPKQYSALFGSSGGGGSSNSFQTIQPDAGTAPVASSPTDTLTLTSTDLTITGNSATDTITYALASKYKDAQLSFTIDGGGLPITTGAKKVYTRVPFACTITGWELVADVAGSIVIDVWKDTYANFPPTVADTIAGSEKPTLSSVIKNNDLSLSTWTTSLAKGDYIELNVDSASTVTKVILNLILTKV